MMTLTLVLLDLQLHFTEVTTSIKKKKKNSQFLFCQGHPYKALKKKKV